VKYRTIVADPPWHYGRDVGQWTLDYPTMTIEEICALPVVDLAENDAHLYLWTTNTHLPLAFEVVEAWGFIYKTMLVWCKNPNGATAGTPTYASRTEFVLFARRGSLSAKSRATRNWWEWPRKRHSQKPEAFLDLVEQVSPGPYLELFARRNRLGWDTWGNESLEHVEMV
jgi:N6-adenosine-specific RNA methylase IME4